MDAFYPVTRGRFRIVLWVCKPECPVKAPHSDPHRKHKNPEAAQRLSASQLVGIVDRMPIGIFHLNTSWEFTYVNERALIMLEKTPQELLGHTMTEVYPELAGSLTDRVYRQAMRTGNPVEFVNHYETWDKWLEMNVFPSHQGLVVVFKDISLQQLQEHQRRMQEAALKVVANAVVITDRDGIIQWYNQSFANSYGLEEGEALGKNPRDLIKSGVHDEAFFADLWNTILGGEIWMGEIVNRRKDGRLITEEMTITPVFNEEGDIWIFIAVKQDISQRKETERMIRRQADLIELASDAIVVCDHEGTVRFWNQRAQTGFGWDVRDAIGASVQTIMSWDASDYEQARAVCAREGEWAGEVELANRLGDRIRCLVRWTLVAGVDGRPDSILGLYTDITALHDLTRRFERIQRLESIGTLAGGIAHDLNNMLSPVLMGTEILSVRETDEKRLAIIASMQKSVQRSADLVQNLLTVASGVEGKRASIDMHHFMDDLERFTRTLLPPDVALGVRVPADPWPVMGDASQLRNAITNLVRNAIDALPGGGSIDIDASNIQVDSQFAAAMHGSETGMFVCLRVSDNGSGMSKEQIERVFDPFFTTKEFGEGAGLGLSATLGIIRGHGGFMDIQSEPGHGTSVSLFVPAQAEPDDAELPNGNGELIMVVDDEEGIRTVTAATLTSAGYDVLVAEDGTEAIGLFAKHRKEVALVITDLHMPNMDGTALIRALARMQPDVRVAVWTGSGVPIKEQAIAGLRIACHIEKPVPVRKLLTTIRTVLETTS